MKYEQERWDLLCLQAYTNPLPGSASSQLECYTSTVTAIVSVTLTATDIQGADLSEPLVLFWHRHREGAWNKLATATLSWLSFISDTLSHLTLLSRSLEHRWKEAPGFWLGLLSQLIMYVQAYWLFSIVPQSILNLRIPLLTSRSAAYHRGHLNWVIGIVVAMCAFQSAHLLILPFTTTLLHAAQEQPYVMSYICDVIHSNAYFRLRATGLLFLKSL